MDGESWVQSQSLTGHRSESKILVGQKRGVLEIEETSDSSHKRVKMRDLESVFRSEGKGGSNTDSRTLDLNANDGPTKSRGFHLDLNAEDISSSINDPFYPSKQPENLKSRDDSECASSIGPFSGKDPMRAWKGLKQNNFISSNCRSVPVPIPKPENLKSRDDSECASSIGPFSGKDPMRAWKGLKQNNFISSNCRSVPVPIPKPRARKKSNNDTMKKKIELAKKEQVDRFARIAAPSGLLNGLNPGIINHVRNSKQVHSIIEALVKSERSEDQIKNGEKEREDHIKNGDNYPFFSRSMCPNNEVKRGDDVSSMGNSRVFSRMSSQWNVENEEDGLALKLSSSVKAASENTSCLSNNESGNLSSVSSLSVKAANVASQWLELLSQDIRGRLAALKRSKKRVRAVITTDLPLLMLKEFSSNSEKDSYNKKGFPDQANADAHSVRWSGIFGQMDKALSEEEVHLESWLNQVKEMQLHCEKGLHKNNNLIGNDNRLAAADNSEKDLAVSAAAASIYSTCNFLLSIENQPCC